MVGYISIHTKKENSMWDWIEEFDLFLFDFDGLLVDTEPLHYAAFMNLCEKHGYALEWDLSDYCKVAHSGGFALKEKLCSLYPHLEKEQGSWESFYKEKEPLLYEEFDQKGLKLMPGADELLEQLSSRKKAFCVATHSKRVWTEHIVQQLPSLQRIPLWVTREDFSQPKPSPESFLQAIDRMHGHDKRVIGFEDAPRGVRALQQTPAKRVLVQQEPLFPEEFFNDPAFYFCQSLQEVGEALAQKQ